MAAQSTINSSVNDVNVMSYNTSGWNVFKAQYIQSMILAHSLHVLVLQEHWLLDKNIHKLDKYFDNFEIFTLPAVKPCSQINKGRPSGGLSILYSKQISPFVKRILCPGSNRVQAISVSCGDVSYVYINCYFPVDPQSPNADITDLLKCLQDVQYVVDHCDAGSKLILLGDINIDYSRNTSFVNLVKTSFSNIDLISVWTKFVCDYTYSSSRFHNGLSRTFYSTIDHFCLSSNILPDCIDAFPLDNIDNTSGHRPIYMKLKCNGSNLYNDQNVDSNNFSHGRPMWNKATDNNINAYVDNLDNMLSDLDIPLDAVNCNNVHCSCAEHISDLDSYAACVMDSISSAVEHNIPYSTNSQSSHKPPIPGWNDFVKPYREDSMFWHSIWVSAGRPQNTSLHQVMKSTRNQYHYAIRRVKQQESKIRKDQMLQDCLNGKINDILKHIKNSRKNKSSYAENIDGISGSNNISSHFQSIYKDIFNQHTSDRINTILQDINNSIHNSDTQELDKITDELIKNIITNLKFGKSDELYDWGTDALKYGVDLVSPHFRNLFRGFLVHGHISQFFLSCALIPIVKDQRSSKLSSDNYRLIAISSLLLKIFDYIILSLYGPNFVSDTLQFGFQKGSSTTQCSWTLIETINYFTNRGSSMFVCLLDLSKAFDAIKHDKLFLKLKGHIPPIFLRLVIYIYAKQEGYVKWNNQKSQSFNVTNGVRQGAVASPTFFNVYINDLFHILKHSGFGCTIDSFYYGMLGYADDCCLLTPSREALQNMMDICSAYFKDHGIKISVNKVLKKTKTKCLSINTSIVPANIMLNGRPLPWVDSHSHLGHLIHRDESMCHDLLSKRGEFISNIHALRQEMGDQSPVVFMKLVNIYYTSMYGSNLWDLFGDAANKLFISYNILIRSTYNLPFATHRYVLQEIVGTPHLRILLLRRFVKFYRQLQNSIKPEVSYLMNIQKSDFRSIFGRNCQHLCRELNVENMDEIILNNISMPIQIPESEKYRIPLLKDLVDIRQNTPDNLSIDEINCMIKFVCCS